MIGSFVFPSWISWKIINLVEITSLHFVVMNVSPNGAPTFELNAIIVSPHFLHGYQHKNFM